jgi:hypothetical protein
VHPQEIFLWVGIRSRPPNPLQTTTTTFQIIKHQEIKSDMDILEIELHLKPTTQGPGVDRRVDRVFYEELWNVGLNRNINWTRIRITSAI